MFNSVVVYLNRTSVNKIENKYFSKQVIKNKMRYYRKMILKIRRGQSTLEYVIILAVVVGAIIGIAAIVKPNFASTYNMIYGNTSNTTAAGIASGVDTSGGGGGAGQYQAE
jgi:hypothetical protein